MSAYRNQDDLQLQIDDGEDVVDGSISKFRMDDDDLEVDAAGACELDIFRGCIPENIQQKKLQIDERYDSGYGHSFQSLTLDICNSGGLSSVLEHLTVEDDECHKDNSKDVPLQILRDVKVHCDDNISFDELSDIFEQDSDGDTQLHNAIIQLLMPIAVYFINKVPSSDYLNIPNNLLQMPLHLAVITRMKSVVRRLVVAGADIIAPDHKGDTPLHIACREGLEDIAGVLLEPVTYNETLENRYKIPYQRIPQNLELKNYNGQTCLHLAAEGTHLAIMRQLLKNGSNINAQDGKSGRTVLHYAAETNNKVLLEFLLQFYNVELECKTYGGLTPMLLAQGRGFKDVILRLMQAGAKFESLRAEESDSDDDMDDLCLGGTPISSYR